MHQATYLPDSEDTLISKIDIAPFLLILKQRADIKHIITQIKVELPTLIGAREERDLRERVQRVLNLDAPERPL